MHRGPTAPSTEVSGRSLLSWSMHPPNTELFDEAGHIRRRLEASSRRLTLFSANVSPASAAICILSLHPGTVSVVISERARHSDDKRQCSRMTAAWRRQCDCDKDRTRTGAAKTSMTYWCCPYVRCPRSSESGAVSQRPMWNWCSRA